MSKKWGKGDFWGLGSEFDPDWVLTESQKKLRDDLIDLCKRKIRPTSAENDKNYTFPRESLNALAELGLLGLLVPKELGGRGENHVCAFMVTETIARYGCPSTAMIYCMHTVAVADALIRHHNNEELTGLLARLDKDKLVGTAIFSDPTTGGKFWALVACKSKFIDENTIQILKYGSWCTSAGHADWYVAFIHSPDATGINSYPCFAYFYKDEVRANNSEWSALGMHANMSGPVVIEGKFNRNRIIGSIHDGPLDDNCWYEYKVSDENLGRFQITSIPIIALTSHLIGNMANEGSGIFFLVISACFSGIAMACMDIAKKHVTRKTHADVGMRICDYVTIQDYFGDCITETTSSRMQLLMIAEAQDKDTKNCDWSLFLDQGFSPRAKYVMWVWMAKCKAAAMVYKVSDKMMQACGGTGYKTDLGLERLLRDAKAGWVMGPSNETLRNFLGKMTLFGAASADIFEVIPNERMIHHELQKMSLEKKKELAKTLLDEVKANEGDKPNKHPYQDTDFENPFNTRPPVPNDKVIKTLDDVVHERAFRSDSWTTLTLKSSKQICDQMESFTFSLPKETDHIGCLPGQYVAVRVTIEEKQHSRFFSPVSRPDDFGKIELVIKYETQGIISQHFQSLKPGDKVEMQGPCGGFEYEANKLDHLTLIASGGGITPGMQLIRCIMKNPKDKTSINLFYYSEDYDSILFREELDQYAAADQKLQVLYTVGSAPEDWDGEEGFISTEMLDKNIKKPNCLNHKILVCGGSGMALSCIHSLKALGFPSHHIFVYGQFGTQIIKTVYGRNVKFSGHTCDGTTSSTTS